MPALRVLAAMPAPTIALQGGASAHWVSAAYRFLNNGGFPGKNRLVLAISSDDARMTV
jgi:hypothetical protein